MNKSKFIQKIISQLSRDLTIFTTAAKTAHEASIHEENLPDNKYDTLALEASYVAQGQANRASEIRQAIDVYKNLTLHQSDDKNIRLTSMVTLEAEDGTIKSVFIGPQEGGMKIVNQQIEIIVITPGSPLGTALIGKNVGDEVSTGTDPHRLTYQIVASC
jgi:transcription elongation GreA/GreB family factor